MYILLVSKLSAFLSLKIFAFSHSPSSILGSRIGWFPPLRQAFTRASKSSLKSPVKFLSSIVCRFALKLRAQNVVFCQNCGLSAQRNLHISHNFSYSSSEDLFVCLSLAGGLKIDDITFAMCFCASKPHQDQTSLKF